MLNKHQTVKTHQSNRLSSVMKITKRTEKKRIKKNLSLEQGIHCIVLAYT